MRGAGENVFSQQNVYLQKNDAVGGVGTAEAAFGLEVRSWFCMKTLGFSSASQKYGKFTPDLNFAKFMGKQAPADTFLA